MAGDALRRTVEVDTSDALADLGSPAVLEALCDGPPARTVLLRAMRASEAAAADTFAGWAGTAGADAAASAYSAAAERERDHERRVAKELPDDGAGADAYGADAPGAPGPLHAYLRGLEDPAARVGAGLVGRPLAALRTYDRARAWAEAHDDTGLADLVAELAAETEPSFGTGVDLLGDAGPGDDRWEAAVAAGAYTVRLIRDDHADALATLGRSFR